jgi:Flp pilus assembly protein TadG
MLTSRRVRRRGAALVEFAFVAPVVLFLMLAQIIGGLGILRLQEMSHLARACARYAATHGGDYQQEGIAGTTGVAAVASSTDLRNFLVGKTVLLDLSRLQINVTWTTPSGFPVNNTPVYGDPNSVPPGAPVTNNVIVTLRYPWIPEGYLVGPINLTSTSQMPMSY